MTFILVIIGIVSGLIRPQAPTIALAAENPVSAVDIPAETLPAPSALSYGACPAIIAEALGWSGCMIAWCESGWDANETGGYGERGYFQIHPLHFDSTYDPAGNVAAAVRISGGGADWGPWSVRGVLTSGRCPNGDVPPI